MRFGRKRKFAKACIVAFCVLLLGVFCAEAVLQVLGFAVRRKHKHEGAKAMAMAGSDRAVTVLCIGESTTYESYPSQLQELLDQKLGKGKVLVVDRGEPTLLTADIVARLDANLRTFKPDVVIAMIGINDAYEFSTREPKVMRYVRFFRLGRLLADLFSGRFAGVEKHLSQPLPDSRLDAGPLLRLGRQLADRTDQFRYAVKSSTPLPEQPTQPVEADADLASLSRVELEKIVQRQPDCLAAVLALAGLSDTGQALEMYDGLYRRFPASMSLLENCRVFLDKVRESHDSGQLQKGLLIAKRCLEHDADNPDLYFYAGCVLGNQGNRKDWLRFCRELVAKKPGDVTNAFAYACALQQTDQFASALVWFDAVLSAQNDPQLRQAVFARMWECLLAAGSSDELEKYMRSWKPGFSRAEHLRFLRMLKSRLLDSGKVDAAQTLQQQLTQLEIEGTNAQTRANYLRICQQVLARRGCVFVAMQYPLRSVDALKHILLPVADRIWFFDNYGVFRDAVVQNGLSTYFYDMFGFDFGHTTPQGSMLLARSVARQLMAGPLRYLQKTRTDKAH